MYNYAYLIKFVYMHNRSIVRLAQVTLEKLKESVLANPPTLTHEKELKLAKCIIRFPEIVSRILDDLYPHTLCDYIYELCTTFTDFYSACYCVEKDAETGAILSVNTNRLVLCEATAQVMERSFYMLGINPVEKM